MQSDILEGESLARDEEQDSEVPKCPINRELRIALGIFYLETILPRITSIGWACALSAVIHDVERSWLVKRRIAVVVLAGLSLIGSGVWATDFRIGLKAGADLGFIGGRDFQIDLNDLDDSGEGQSEARIGFSGGIYFIIGLSEILSLQQEVLYSMFGTSFSYTSSGEDVTGWQVAHVLEMPLTLRAQMPLGPGMLFAFAGPGAVLFLGDIIERTESDGDSDVSKLSPDHPAALGLSVGLGYELPVGNGLLSFDLRGTATLSEIFRQSDYRYVTMYLLVGYGWAF